MILLCLFLFLDCDFFINVGLVKRFEFSLLFVNIDIYEYSNPIKYKTITIFFTIKQFSILSNI